jgi:hypothetical protein
MSLKHVTKSVWSPSRLAIEASENHRVLSVVVGARCRAAIAQRAPSVTSLEDSVAVVWRGGYRPMALGTWLATGRLPSHAKK